MFRSAALTLTLCLTTITALASPVSGQGTWETTLQGRAPLTTGGTDYQAYYDTDLNITWVADANLADTTPGFATGGLGHLGAKFWIDSLKAQNGGVGYLGVNNWRMPKWNHLGTLSYSNCFNHTDCGYNPDPASGDLAHMFYITLGNTAIFDLVGAEEPCYSTFMCLTNTGPFSHVRPAFYWYSDWSGNGQHVEYWSLDVTSGFQMGLDEYFPGYAWAVRDGDIAAVPLPGGLWLLATGLGALGWRRRKVIA